MIYRLIFLLALPILAATAILQGDPARGADPAPIKLAESGAPG